MLWPLLCAVVLASSAHSIDPANPPPPPLVTTEAWFDWYESLLDARLAAVDFPRDVTRYVSSSMGDDANDGATPETPWRSMARARIWINSSNPLGETREVLFRRGDVWRVSEGVKTESPGVRIADYGDPDAPRPYISGFTQAPAINDAAWTPVDGGPVYYRNAPQAVSWVREDGDVDLDFPLKKGGALVSVIATPGSWWWDSSTKRLYVHPRGGDDPRQNGKQYEYAHTTLWGFSVSGDRSLIENLRADGFGMDPTVGAPQKEAFQSRARNSDQVVIRNCVSFYGGSHIITHNAGAAGVGGVGGVTTIIDCTAGFTRLNASGETVFNAYAGLGENQTIFENCTVARGTLPTIGSTAKRADPVFGHTGGDDARLGLTIVSNLRVLDHPYGSPRTGRFNQTKHAETLEDVRTFFVGTVHEGGANVGDQFCSLFTDNAVYLNCSYTLSPADMGSNGRLQGSNVNGWWINSTLDLDLSHQSGSYFALYNSNSQDNRARIWNSAILLRNVPAGLQFRIDRDGAASTPTGSMVNSVIAKLSGGGSVSITLPNTPANIQANAYWAVTPPAADTSAVVLPAPPDVSTAPAPDSPLVAAGADLPNQTPLDFDQRRNPRIAPLTIGPLDLVNLPADLNGDGVVNGADLAILLANWGVGGSDADLTGDGVVNGADLAALLASWT